MCFCLLNAGGSYASGSRRAQDFPSKCFLPETDASDSLETRLRQGKDKVNLDCLVTPGVWEWTEMARNERMRGKLKGALKVKSEETGGPHLTLAFKVQPTVQHLTYGSVPITADKKEEMQEYMRNSRVENQSFLTFAVCSSAGAGQ